MVVSGKIDIKREPPDFKKSTLYNNVPSRVYEPKKKETKSPPKLEVPERKRVFEPIRPRELP
jgi:hypothetical protein